jgi:hypothetical protein
MKTSNPVGFIPYSVYTMPSNCLYNKLHHLHMATNATSLQAT